MDKRVCGASLALVEAAGFVAVLAALLTFPTEVTEVVGSWPSRIAFSRANFSARSRLSCSICALTRARAFASSILSVHEYVYQ